MEKEVIYSNLNVAAGTEENTVIERPVLSTTITKEVGDSKPEKQHWRRKGEGRVNAAHTEEVTSRVWWPSQNREEAGSGVGVSGTLGQKGGMSHKPDCKLSQRQKS